MQVKLTIVVDVEAEDPSIFTEKTRVLGSVRRAIQHAIQYGENEGFDHEMENDISLSVDVGPALEMESDKPNADILLVCKQARASMRRLANHAGDVDEWNEGGHAYEASQALGRIIEAHDGKQDSIASVMLAALKRAVDSTENDDYDWVGEAESAIEQAEMAGVK